MYLIMNAQHTAQSTPLKSVKSAFRLSLYVSALSSLVSAYAEPSLPKPVKVASAPAETPFSISEDRIKQASEATTWRRLLLLKKDNTSDIRHADFFLSDTLGGTPIDPAAELKAVLSAWQAGDERVCQFVARTLWLKKTLGIDTPLPVCADFQAWQARLSPKSLSLVFADEHPNNLASGFGHTLMKLEGADGDDTAINYTPNYGATDNPAVGAMKSLTGGYIGVMEILPFAQKNSDYRHKDERDIWQYRFNLTPDELDFLIRHIWEVKDMARPYFLTHDNCATEILRLLDVVRADLSLQADMGHIITPAKAAALVDKAGLVEKTEFFPSNATVRQAQINDASATLNPRYNPVSASGIHRLSVYAKSGDAGGDGVGVALRSAYKDLLDRPDGVRQYTDLSILSADVFYDERLKLNEAVLISHRGYNPVNSEKAYDGRAHGLHLRFTQVNDGQDKETPREHLVFHGSMERGKSWAVGRGQGGDLPDGLCYALGFGAAEVGRIAKGYRVGVGANVGCVYQKAEHWRVAGELSLSYWAHQGRDGVHYFAPKATLKAQYDLSPRTALRLESSHEWLDNGEDSSLKLGVLRYF